MLIVLSNCKIRAIFSKLTKFVKKFKDERENMKLIKQ